MAIKISISHLFMLVLMCQAAMLISFVNSQDTTVTPPSLENFDCRRVIMVIAKKQLKVFGECSREHKAMYPDQKDYQRKIQCVVKCALEKENLLDEDKQITSASIQHFLDAHIPQMFHEMGHTFVDNCKAEFDGKMDANDENCLSYGEFVKCMQNTIGNYC